HHERALPAELVPNGKGRADGAARIAGRRLYVHARNGVIHRTLPLTTEFYRTASGHRDVSPQRSCRTPSRCGWEGPRPQQMLERGRKQIAELGRSIRPLIGHILEIVTEEPEIESRRLGAEAISTCRSVAVGRPQFSDLRLRVMALAVPL